MTNNTTLKSTSSTIKYSEGEDDVLEEEEEQEEEEEHEDEKQMKKPTLDTAALSNTIKSRCNTLENILGDVLDDADFSNSKVNGHDHQNTNSSSEIVECMRVETGGKGLGLRLTIPGFDTSSRDGDGDHDLGMLEGELLNK